MKEVRDLELYLMKISSLLKELEEVLNRAETSSRYLRAEIESIIRHSKDNYSIKDGDVIKVYHNGRLINVVSVNTWINDSYWWNFPLRINEDDSNDKNSN